MMDNKVIEALENGILKEIKHRTNDVINDISIRINQSLNEIIQTITNGAQDLEECIRQDIMDSFPTLKRRMAFRETRDEMLVVNTSKSERKVARESKEKNRVKEEPVQKAQSGGNSGQASNKLKIGLKEWKQWKEKKQKNYNQSRQVKEERYENGDEDQETINYNKFLTLEDCMEEDASNNPVDRYTRNSRMSTEIETDEQFFQGDSVEDEFNYEDKPSQSKTRSHSENKSKMDQNSNVDELIERLDAYWTKKNGDRRYKGRCKICDHEGKMDEVRVHIKKQHPDQIGE